MSTLENFDTLDYHQMRMDLEKTLAADDFSIRHDVDGIVRALWCQGIRSREQLEDLRDPDLLWTIAADYELT